jgi:hypothetical protein
MAIRDLTQESVDEWLVENSKVYKGFDVSTSSETRVYLGGGKYYTCTGDETRYTIIEPDDKEVLHNGGDDPAFISPLRIEWHRHGLVHRATAPAIVYPWKSIDEACWAFGGTVFDPRGANKWFDSNGHFIYKKEYISDNGVLLSRWVTNKNTGIVLSADFQIKKNGVIDGYIHRVYGCGEIIESEYFDKNKNRHRADGPAYTHGSYSSWAFHGVIFEEGGFTSKEVGGLRVWVKDEIVGKRFNYLIEWTENPCTGEVISAKIMNVDDKRFHSPEYMRSAGGLCWFEFTYRGGEIVMK